ncbi:MAG: hypothetical protein KA109_14530 [Saprospiraceae bacterium]|nr:hypothetical protein [Saprospiraceae bacterium]MBP7802840.1 hypothetical protein [Saprospiraceae bacterium]MBP7924045.1 hypothetical protein [Saprospiraceae bacterium]MBP8942897.1 hypothetical protein [Saprospiraceae bacterium]MBP9746339.1 hypothetical protein [Saprospiraceae bacterium]
MKSFKRESIYFNYKVSGILEQRAECAVYWCDDVTSSSCGSYKYRFRGEVISEVTQPGVYCVLGLADVELTLKYTRSIPLILPVW